MDKTRLWIIGSVLAMVVVAALGWVLAIQPQLDQSAAADVQTEQVNATNAANRAVLVKLKKESEQLPALKEQLAALATSIPAAAETPAFADQLSAAAEASGVTVTGWQITDAQGFVPPANPAVPAAPAAGSGAGPTSTGTPTPAATPTAASTPSPVPTAVPGMPPAPSPLVTKDVFSAIPVTVSVRGEYANIVAFVAAAQKGQRLFLVDNVNIGPASNGPGFDGKVGGLIYVLKSPEKETPAK